MARTIYDRITAAQASFEAGFLSTAAKKRAQDNLNRAFDDIRNATMTAILAARTEANEEENHADYWGLCSDLHQVREKHIAIIAKYEQDAQTVRDLIALRAAIKDAELAPVPAKPEVEQKAEAIRKTIIEQMEARKAQFIEALDIARHFNGLPVSVTAHWVYGHKGSIFLRRFFYLRGKLTALNVIMAAAEAYEREQAAAENEAA